jgi:hypothetical protein
MHIIESYATHCGLQIDKPWIYDSYFPLNQNHYITLQPSGGADVRDYDYWDEVIFYLKPELDKRGIKIVQLGLAKDRAIDGCLHTHGATTLSQTAYLIKNSMLHLGVDSVGVHMASSYGKKIVGLYCNQWTRSSGPYWSDPKDVVLHEPNRDGVKPSFALSEDPKTINEISAEKVAQSVFDLLGVDYKVPYERVHIGRNYPDINVQNIPTSVARLNNNPLGEHPLIVRMDLHFDEDILSQQLNQMVCVVCTEKALDRVIIKNQRQRIQNLVYYLGKDHDPDFVKFMHTNGIKYTLMTKLEDEELNDIKMDYLDYSFIFKKYVDEEGFEKLKGQDLSNYFYKTRKKILKDGKSYNSVSNVKAGAHMESINDFSFTPIVENEDFWDFLDETYVVKKLD